MLWSIRILTLELAGEARQRQVIDGAQDETNGGTTVYLAPGARVGLVFQPSR